MKKKRILLILTGGTISMDKHRDLSSDILHLQQERLLTLNDSMLDDITFDTHVFTMKPSPHITLQDMLSLAKFIDRQIEENIYQGFVITHGTDTLEETSFFLDLYFSTTSVPIVITGSMRNFSDIAYDGLNNIVSSLLVSSHTDASKHGVLVVLNDMINTAREVTKSHTVSLDTFKSLDFGPIGVIDDLEILFYRQIPKKIIVPKIDTIDSKVYIYQTFTGDDGHLLDSYLDADALIIQAFGRGNVPPLLTSKIIKFLRKKIPVIITSRVPMGRVYNTYLYDGGGGTLQEMGCLLSPQLNSQKARILVAYGLASKLNIHDLINKNRI